MKNREYWAERFMQLEDSKNNKSLSIISEVDEIYEKAIVQINKDIETWYARVAKNNKISMFEAKQLLSKGELKEFKWTVEEYIKYGEANALNQSYMNLLENASARVHISRLEALKLQTRHTIEIMEESKNKAITQGFNELYSNNYYHSAFEIQKGVNLGWSLQTVNAKQIETVLNKPWAVDGRNFSERIWNDKQKLINTIHTELSQAIIRGQNPQSIVKTVANKLNVSKSQAARLVHTESAYIASASQKDCFNDLDVESFEYVATLDSKTSELCRDMDGRVFEMKLYEIGVTAPPLHVFCRSCVAPWFSDNYTERIVGGGSGAYFIDSNITYNEWKEKFVK